MGMGLTKSQRIGHKRLVSDFPGENSGGSVWRDFG
jgi:hypothetical protein